jgi:hypothetical protein
MANTTQQQPLSLATVQAGNANVAVLRAAVAPHVDLPLNRKFIEGDHWQDGKGWVGPGPRPSDPTYRDIIPLIQAAFTSRNVIDEVCDRLMSSIVGKEPRWTWAPVRALAEDEEPTTEEDALIGEVNAFLTTWWNERQAHAALKDLIYKMLFGQRSVWRLYVPTGLATDGKVSGTDLGDALNKLYLDIPEPEDGGVWEDPETKQKVGIVLWRDASNKEHAEVVWLDGTMTKIQILPDSGAPISNDYGGALPIFQVCLPSAFVTEQLRSLNRMLNMTLTLLGKGLVDNHFLERLMLNAMPPGHWEYEEQPDPDTGEKIRKAYVADRHVTGGRTTTYVQGVDFKDELGRTNIKDPSVVFRDPTDPGATIKGADYWYGAMLDEARQSHVIVNQSNTIGFKSREQARGDFIDSTHDVQLQAEMAGAALLLTVVKMAEAIANQRGKYTKTLKPVFKCRPNYGPLTVEERTQNVAEAKDGFMADETAMSLNGIDDTDAEQAAIQAQPRAALALSTAQAGAVKAWVDAGFTHEVALTLIGMDEDEVKRIIKLNADTTATTPPVDPNAPPVPPNAPPAAGGA